MTSDCALTGGCLCGAIRYRAGGPLAAATCCHCASCRRATGAHAVVWVTVAAASLHYTAGMPATFQSSDSVRRTFCADCGSPLSYWNAAREGEIDLAIGSLDEPAAMPPRDHIWMDDALAWHNPRDGLPLRPRGHDPR